MDDCVGGTDPKGIANCTRLIESKQFAGEDLARLYYERGVKFQFNKDLRRALGDMEAAIRLAPNVGEFMWGRGCLKFLDLGDKRGGRTDIAKAKQLGFALDDNAPCGL